MCDITVSGGWYNCFRRDLEFFRVDSYIYYICDMTWKLIQKCYITFFNRQCIFVFNLKQKIANRGRSLWQTIIQSLSIHWFCSCELFTLCIMFNGATSIRTPTIRTLHFLYFLYESCCEQFFQCYFVQLIRNFKLN